MTNNNKVVDMKQVWQQMEPVDTATSALSALTTSEDGNDRFMYYLSGSTFRRYDTYANTWHKLASPLLTPTNFASLRFSKYSGNFGRVISATSTTVRLAGLNAGVFDGKTIRIIAGTGAGQARTISASSEPVKYDQGLATTASTTTIGDSTKKWAFNQWTGYQVRLTYSTGLTQIRKILYNDATTLTIADTNYQAIDSFNNAAFTVTPSTTAGSQTHFVIEACDLTVPTWTITPDYTSRYKIESGGVWLLTSKASAPYASVQYYDVAGDFWIYKTVPTNFFTSAFGTDGTLERTGEIGGVYVTGTATAGGNYTLTDTSKSLTVNQYKNYRIRITAGTGAGQSRRIVANGANYFETARKWDINPSTDSTYEIIADKDKLYLAGNAQSAMYQYDVDADLIIQGAKSDDGIANVLSARHSGIDTPTVAITSGTRGTGGITAVGVSAGGTGHAVGDIITLTTGTLGKVQVTSISTGGVVTGVSLLRPGTGYSVTTFAQSATTGGGTGFVASVTAVGIICNVVTTINHHFGIGDQVILAGDSNYAGTVTIIGCDSLTGFDFVTAAAGNMTAANALSVTQHVDATKNWTPNEHVGKILQTHLVGTAGSVTSRVITANTATTITTVTIGTAMVNGTGRYVIIDPAAFGRDEQYKNPTKANWGNATGGSTTTLIDSTKNWTVDQWAGAKIRINAGTGRDAFITITSNTATTLTYPTQTFTPDATTVYLIQDTFGTSTATGTTTTLIDSTKKWITNQWAGKRLRLLGGNGTGANGNEATILSNTSNTLTLSAAIATAPDTNTTYSILSIPVRGAGIQLVWAFGGVSNGRYMYLPVGGGSIIFNRYDITREVWEYPIYITPQTDSFTTGSYYAYDGSNRLYLSPGVATGAVQYIYYLDLTTNKVMGFGSVPNTQLAPVIGNRMEIIDSPQGISYLYHMRNTATEMYRAMIFF